MTISSSVSGTASVDLSDLAQINDALNKFLRKTHGTACEARNLKRCSVGFSWMTLALDLHTPGLPDVPLILQIGPPNGLLAPYSARPQVLALSSLADSSVAVARTMEWSDQPDVFGAPFYIQHRVSGAPLSWNDMTVDHSDAMKVVDEFLDMLAALHSFEWRNMPVAEIYNGCTPENAAQMQIDSWAASIERWSIRRYPMLDWATQWLRDNVPVAPQVGIVHGDYRFGNFLCEHARITAILDWEMVHFGDPHEDLAWAFLPMFNRNSDKVYGILPRAEAIARYEAKSGIKIDLHCLHYYEVFAVYKCIAILAAAAYQAQAGGSRDLRMAAMASQLVPSLALLRHTLEMPQ